MEHEAPKPDCILQIEAIGCCDVCVKKVKKGILRLEGIYSVEIDRERRWAKIAGNVEQVMDYFTRRSGKCKNAKVIFYCSKEAKTDHKYHGKNYQTDHYTENTPMENQRESHVKYQAENNLPKETQNPNEYHCHQKNIPEDNNSNDTRQRNYKREGGNYNQDSNAHTTGDHYVPIDHDAPRKDWVHRVENYVPPPPKEDQYRSVRVDDRECRCEFHAWKRQGSGSCGSGRFVFDHRVPRADMRSASARWFREEPTPFYGYHEPFMPLPRPLPGPFAYR